MLMICDFFLFVYLLLGSFTSWLICGLVLEYGVLFF